MRRALCGLAPLACALLAQAPDRARPSQTPGEVPKLSEARIEGRVLSDPGALALRRAHISSRPLEAGLTAFSVQTGEKGDFAIRDIAPGRYSLIADRDGYASATFTIGALRSPASVYIGSGDQIASVEFHLHHWAVLSGRIRFDDEEPAGNVRVDLYREYYVRGRQTFSPAASALTNDRGEYRLYGLPPGAYFLAATYARQTAASYVEQAPLDAAGHEMPITGYTTTFYPHTAKLAEALPVHLDFGQQFEGFDLSLMLVRKLKLRGRVTSGVTGLALTNAGITLTRADESGFSGIATTARPTFDRKGAFVIRDVPAGSYVVRVDATDAGIALAGRALITVGNEDIDNLQLLAAPAQTWPGHIRIEGGKPLPGNRTLRVALEPRSDTGTVVQPDVRGFDFEAAVMRDETYDVFVDNLPDDFYLPSVRVGGADVRALGLPGSLASRTPFETVLDSRGAKLSGLVVGPDGEVWSGVNLMLLPAIRSNTCRAIAPAQPIITASSTSAASPQASTR
jgi:hypothetical protein